MSAVLLPSGHSPAFLPPAGPVRRHPRSPWIRRPQSFYDRFEDRAIVYDCFWHDDGERILLVGPPPLGLGMQAARYEAFPSGVRLQARLHVSASVAITELTGAPAGTLSIKLMLGENDFTLPVGENLSPQLAGRRIVFTMSQDNDLAWIAEWARYHVRVQQADTVIVFDNASKRYRPQDIENALLPIPGLRFAAVQSWPYRYGSPDRAILSNPYYTLFLQIGAMSVVLRRYGARAYGILNCDIDELVATPANTSVFDRAHASRSGLLVMRGRFIEPVPLPGSPSVGLTHRHYGFRCKDPSRSLSRQKKWAIDPTRRWFADLGVHPYMHWIHGRPLFSKTQPDDVFYRHFRAIHNGWKDKRAEAGSIDPDRLTLDRDFTDLYTAGEAVEAFSP